MSIRTTILAACAGLMGCVSPPASAGAAAESVASLDGLIGCWSASGEVQGKHTENAMRGSWRLDRRYVLLEVHGLDPADPYDAAIVMADAGEGALTAFWMDSFGGAYSVSGAGRATGSELVISYAYPDAIYVNRFARTPEGWAWRITEEKAGETPQLFAQYELRPASCAGMPDVF